VKSDLHFLLGNLLLKAVCSFTSMPYIFPVEEYPDLAYGWEASEGPPPRKHVTDTRTLKLKFDHRCKKKKGWTSMKGMAKFEVWRRGGSAFISCSIYYQQCNKCQEWAEGKVYEREFNDLVADVVEKFSHPKTRGRGVKGTPGNPKGNHDSERCEACQLGICQRNSSDTED